jgi:protein tyrosine phosphatase (PTP) superfamily phosphohydrolase (DUF442 family)
MGQAVALAVLPWLLGAAIAAEPHPAPAVPASPAERAEALAPPTPAAVLRPPAWAQPLARPGLPNLHLVAPGIYRGAQPTAEGMRELEKLGVRTVINLRGFHSDDDELEGTGLRAERIRFHTWHAEDEDTATFLSVVTDPAKRPVFIHCLHGADRTGTMCAIYRMAVQGWGAEAALREMTSGGYGYHAVWVNLPRYLRALDVPALRARAGIAEPSASP